MAWQRPRRKASPLALTPNLKCLDSRHPPKQSAGSKNVPCPRPQSSQSAAASRRPAASGRLKRLPPELSERVLIASQAPQRRCARSARRTHCNGGRSRHQAPAAAEHGRHLEGAGSINLVRPERKTSASLY